MLMTSCRCLGAYDCTRLDHYRNGDHMHSLMPRSATRVSQRTTHQSGSGGGSTRTMSGCTNSWARTTCTSTRFTGPQSNLATGAPGRLSTTCLPQVLQIDPKRFIADTLHRVPELRGWQVLKESQSRRVRSLSEGDWHPA